MFYFFKCSIERRYFFQGAKGKENSGDSDRGRHSSTKSGPRRSLQFERPSDWPWSTLAKWHCSVRGVQKAQSLPKFPIFIGGQWEIVVENFEPKFCTLDCDLTSLNNMQCISDLSNFFLAETVFPKARLTNQCIGYVSYTMKYLGPVHKCGETRPSILCVTHQMSRKKRDDEL